MADATRDKLLTAVQCCNAVLETLDDPAYALVEQAVFVLEDAYLRWPDTDRKIKRTWVKVAMDGLREALEIMDKKEGAP